jgi:hypothetical protein
MSQHKKIADLVIKYTGENIYSKRRTQPIVDARALFEYIMREDYKVTYQSITDHYRKNGKKRKHDVMIYSVRNFENEIRHRRKDLNEYYQNILETEITVRQYQNAYLLISQIKNQKQIRKFRKYMTDILKEPAKV